MHSFYEVQPDRNHWYLISETDWQFESKFMFGQPVLGVPTPTFRPCSLDEALADDFSMLEEGEVAAPNQTRDRFEAGYGDCVYVEGFGTALVFSQNALQALNSILTKTGQTIDTKVEEVPLYIFNCTNLIDAVDETQSEIRFVGNQRPSAFTRLTFRESALRDEMIFKIQWPRKLLADDVDYSEVPPPLAIYCSQEFVEIVKKSALTGFRFKRAQF